LLAGRIDFGTLTVLTSVFTIGSRLGARVVPW